VGGKRRGKGKGNELAQWEEIGDGMEARGETGQRREEKEKWFYLLHPRVRLLVLATSLAARSILRRAWSSPQKNKAEDI